MADVEENMEEVAVEEQAKAEDTPVTDDKAQSTTVGGVTMDEGMCAHMIYCLFVHGRGRELLCLFIAKLDHKICLIFFTYIILLLT